jgi:hypothetical protein
MEVMGAGTHRHYHLVLLHSLVGDLLAVEKAEVVTVYAQSIGLRPVDGGLVKAPLLPL